MSRPITAVHVDIARFLLEVSQAGSLSADSAESADKKLADWTRGLARCLALRDPSAHEYGALLLCEVETYRKAEIARKTEKFPRNPRNAAESADSLLRSDQIRAKQSNKEERVPPAAGGAPKVKPTPRPKPEFDPKSVAYEAARFMWEYVREWSPQAIEPTEAGYQAWARDCDLMFRKDGRTPEAFNELLDWIDNRKESKDGFSWRKNVLCPATLRKRWQEGKFADFLPSELAREEYK